MCLYMAGGTGALSKGRIYSEQGAGERLCSRSVKISWYFQLGWLISQINHKMLNSLLSYLLGM